MKVFVTCPKCGEWFRGSQRADCPMCGHLVGQISTQPGYEYIEVFRRSRPLERDKVILFRILAVLLGLFVAGVIASGLYLAGVM